MTSKTLRTLDSPGALDELVQQSQQRPQLLFKHSSACPLSAMAYAELQDHLEEPVGGADYWLVTVQTARPVSNSVEAQLAVRHETPQAIVVRSGKAVWTASHRAITRRSLQAALSSHT